MRLLNILEKEWEFFGCNRYDYVEVLAIGRSVDAASFIDSKEEEAGKTCEASP